MSHKRYAAADFCSYGEIVTRGLTNKQLAFIDEYLVDFNATQAAKRAGYSPKTAYSIGQENLTKPEISQEIERRYQEKTMSQHEVLARLTEMARASLSDFVSIAPDGTYTFNLAQAARNNKMHLLKKIAFSRGRLEIELCDSQAALVTLGRHHKLFTDKSENVSEISIHVVREAKDATKPHD